MSGGDDGFVGGLEGLVFGLLLFVVGTLLVANAWGVVATKFALDAAAREAVRSYVEAPDGASAVVDARAAAADALTGYGRDPRATTFGLTAGTFARCSRVTVHVRATAPFVALPWVGRVGSGEGVTATASELVDPLRAGLAGTSTCG